SSLIVSIIGHHKRFSFAAPIFLELVILIFCATYGDRHGIFFSRVFFVGCLLLAMGMQNALVSVISGSVVRTTHLTGTFTDLGIELAQLKVQKNAEQQELVSKIKLRLFIIFFFLFGALSGAYLYSHFFFRSFLLPCIILG